MMRARLDLHAGARGLPEGLLAEIVAAIRDMNDGDLLGVSSSRGDLGAELEKWSRWTGNAIVAVEPGTGATRWVIRKGTAPAQSDDLRPIGSRLWLYTNFDCNLHCDYCCVRSSPRAPRRELGLARVLRIVEEARALSCESVFVTGGEPFLLADIGEILAACATLAPTTVLTNGMLFRGARREILARLPRDRVTLQISVDSPEPELHDLHRGAGTWIKAMEGIEVARAMGLRVRLAATVRTSEEEDRFRAFLDARGIAAEDRVIRRVAMRGFAEDGVAVSKSDLVPELTITSEGVYWHPVGALDDDLLVSRDIFPLAAAVAKMKAQWQEERAHGEALASVFHCA
jgi:pyruvate-formate lyase-activating enzyme